jgi:hypothetical protein
MSVKKKFFLIAAVAAVITGITVAYRTAIQNAATNSNRRHAESWAPSSSASD